MKSFAYVSQFTLFYICQNCKKKITDLSTLKVIKCNCNSVQRLKDCRRTYAIKIKLFPEDAVLYTCFEDVLKKIFPDLPD